MCWWASAETLPAVLTPGSWPQICDTPPVCIGQRWSLLVQHPMSRCHIIKQYMVLVCVYVIHLLFRCTLHSFDKYVCVYLIEDSVFFIRYISVFDDRSDMVRQP